MKIGLIVLPRWMRRVVQVGFLILFLWMVLVSWAPTEGVPSGWLKAFFLADPLLLVLTGVAARALPPLFLWSLVSIVVTMLFGRIFCGWVCPLGTVHSLAGWAFDKVQSRAKRRDAYSPWQKAKYYVLAAGLAMALFGGHWISLFDPLVLLYRTTATAIYPAFQWAVEETAHSVFQADPHVGPVVLGPVQIGPWHLTSLTEPVYQFFRDHVFSLPRQAFLGAGLVWLVFGLMVAANGYRRRFWCRYLCPLGALLGLLGRWPMLRRQVTAEGCNQCGLCLTACHGASASEAGQTWRPSECLMCLNCSAQCVRESCCFRLVSLPWKKQPPLESVGLSRRGLVWSALGGLLALAGLRATPQGRAKHYYHPHLIRPPGARPEPEFLARCTGCALCMKVCPTGGLQPAITEAGLEGIFTPRLVPLIGHCDYNCTACGHVCPTEAIRPLSLEEKHQFKIGLAAFDPSRCIPYVYGRNCIVCEEHCPVPEKAIYCVPQEIMLRTGQFQTVQLPRVDPNRCIGCGVCEHVCPLDDQPGIRVLSTNEIRHPRHQPIPPEIPSHEQLPYR
ncbi:MAG: 4Fe-4S binding protein [Thermoguttaceae bacterium]|nr:4Fe-4S binding protein [Thermoguttaceae bacterium]MDW8037812.1 4Fe-4S binding protein [Thermoguttaceae bacterium]